MVKIKLSSFYYDNEPETLEVEFTPLGMALDCGYCKFFGHGSVCLNCLWGQDK